MCILMGKRVAVFLNSFLLLQSFLGLNAKIDFFLKKMVLREVFIKLTFRWLQTDLSDLKKHQTIEMLMVEFLRIFKMLHFSNFFEIF